MKRVSITGSSQTPHNAKIPSRVRAGQVLAVSTALAAVMFINELFAATVSLGNVLQEDKVLYSVTRSFSGAIAPVVFKGLAMTLGAFALNLLFCLPWAAAFLIVDSTITKRAASGPRARLLFWFVALYSFFHVYYFVYGSLFPYSKLMSSPLVLLTGCAGYFETNPAYRPYMTPAAWFIPLTGAVVLGTVGVALWQSRVFRRAISIAVVIVFTAIYGYGTLKNTASVRRFQANHNFILIGLDSFQWNRLPVGGAPRNYTPDIDEFLRDSYRFTNAWTPLARTYTAWMSLFTGRYPVNNGIRFNLLPDSFLNPTNRYLPRLMHEAGYFTFHAMDETRFCNLRPKFGYDRLFHPQMGAEDFVFGSYFDFSTAHFFRQCHLGHDLFSPIKNNRSAIGYSPRLWTDNLLRTINRLPADKPLFISMHLCMNHWPFSSPAPFCYRSSNKIECCIAATDYQAGRILRYLEESGLADKSTVIMLSDHGDGWSGDPDDKHATHGDSLERVWSNKIVLGIQSPSLPAAECNELVRIFDLYPTILEWAGQEAPGEIDGLSLTPLVNGRTGPPRTVFAEDGISNTTFATRAIVEENLSWYRLEPQTGLITIRPEVYDKLLDMKSYMLIRDARRLVIDLQTGDFAIYKFDPVRGVDATEPLTDAEKDKRYMLDAVADHYGLDKVKLYARARRQAFIK